VKFDFVLKQAIYSLGCIEMFEAKLGFEFEASNIYIHLAVLKCLKQS